PRRTRTLLDGPGVARAQQRIELVGAGTRAGGAELLARRFAVDGPLDVMEDPDRGRLAGALGDLREREGEAGVGVVGVVHQRPGDTVVAGLGQAEAAAGIADDRALL